MNIEELEKRIKLAFEGIAELENWTKDIKTCFREMSNALQLMKNSKIPKETVTEVKRIRSITPRTKPRKD